MSIHEATFISFVGSESTLRIPALPLVVKGNEFCSGYQNMIYSQVFCWTNISKLYKYMKEDVHTTTYTYVCMFVWTQTYTHAFISMYI